MLALVNIYRPKVDEITKMKIGATNVYLDGTNCRFLECNFGDMISQALILSARRTEQQQIESMANTSIALFASGDIRASIKPGNITKFDLEMALPYPNQLGRKNIFLKIKNVTILILIVSINFSCGLHDGKCFAGST